MSDYSVIRGSNARSDSPDSSPSRSKIEGGCRASSYQERSSTVAESHVTAILSSNIGHAGDLLVGRGNALVGTLPIGDAGQVLTVDLDLALGVKWADPAGGPGGGTALSTTTNTSAFNGLLSVAETNVQLALDALDDHNHDAAYSAIGHNHDTAYSAVGHDHDADYSAIGHTHVQLHDALTVSDTDTMDLTLTGQALSAAVRSQMSITSDASGLKLSGDSATPGNLKLYGTDGAGVRGWYAQSGADTYLALTGGTLTGSLVVDLGADVAGFRVQGAVGQTSNLLILEDSSGTDLVTIGSTGSVSITGADQTNVFKMGGNISSIQIAYSPNSSTGVGYFWQSNAHIAFGTYTAHDLRLGTNNATRVTFGAAGGMTFADGNNISFNTTTGTKIGTATGQKLGFWNVTPVGQPTTAVAAATFINGIPGNPLNIGATFDGYTIPQIVRALRVVGLLA